MNRLIILASLLLFSSSCSKEQSPALEEPTLENSISLGAQLPNTETRLGSNTESNESWTFSWESGDAMGNWHTSGTKAQEFVNKSATGAPANFSGDLGEGDHHRFIYPYEDISIAEGSTLYPIDISSQDGTLNKTYFITQTQHTREQLKDGTVTTLAMEHVGGFMAVDIYLENYLEGYSYTLKKVEYVGIPTKANLDLERDFDSDALCIVTEDSGSVIVEVSEEFAEVTDNEVKYLQAIAKLNIIPFELKDGDKLTVNLTVEITKTATTESADEIISSITFTNSGDQSFGRATHNFTYLLADASHGITISGATINDWSNKESGGDLGLTKVYDITYNTDTSIYEIHTADGMRAFADLVNGSDCSVSNLTIDDSSYFNFGTINNTINGTLLADIDLGGIDANGNGIEEKKWIAIGYMNSSSDLAYFKGNFDGGGHKISGLYINELGSDYQGLFGYLENSTISNLGVSGSVTGGNYTGGIVGYAIGSIVTCCYNNCDVTGTGENIGLYVGGIIGYSYTSNVYSCYNRGEITGWSYVGGVAGHLYMYSKLTDSYNTGEVYCTGWVGGISGAISSSTTVNYGYFDSDEVTEVTRALGGRDNCTEYGALTTTMMKGDATTEGTLLYYFTNSNYGNSTNWSADTEGINGGYPILTWQVANND